MQYYIYVRIERTEVVLVKLLSSQCAHFNALRRV